MPYSHKSDDSVPLNTVILHSQAGEGHSAAGVWKDPGGPGWPVLPNSGDHHPHPSGHPCLLLLPQEGSLHQGLVLPKKKIQCHAVPKQTLYQVPVPRKIKEVN